MPKDLNALQSGMVQQNDVNDPSVRVIRGKNQFPQSFQHPSTCLYGYVDPVAVLKGEVGDVIPYKFVTDLNTFTMKSPMKSEVKMYSAAFKVPMEAIYPRTYDILFSFAQKGDEVPQQSPTSAVPLIANSARAVLPFRTFLTNVLTFFNSSYRGEFSTNFNINNYFRSLFLLESVFSDGGIFAKMNIHVNNLLFSLRLTNESLKGPFLFDDVIDLVLYPRLSDFLDHNSNFIYLQHESVENDVDEGYPVYIPTVDSNLVGSKKSGDDYDARAAYYCSIDRMFELIRTGDWFVHTKESQGQIFEELYESLGFLLTYDNTAKIPTALNIEPIIAYQLACVQFFNNPKVDYLYNVNLWRRNLETFIYDYNQFFPSFDYNGSIFLYDVVSHNCMARMIAAFVDDNSIALDYFFHLFGYHRSLRYGDYFTGARPEPIGVGDINLEEDENGDISSLEVARRLQLTRLLHKVAITGPEHKDQIKYIFGGRIPDAPKDVPIRLSREEFTVEGFETNNTGSAQLSDADPNITTTNLRLTDSKFMFEVEVDEPCWLVMVQYFEAHRIYSNTIDRFAYHYNLYDDFVPDMQFIGDQDLKQSELLGIYGDQYTAYAYHLRNMEYKQRVSYASGGFIRHLPSWAFITDNKDGNPADVNITPEYLRSSPTEFDRFYKSLLGHSLGRRFHFIIMNTNILAPYRQMVYAPEILA